ncbi:MAG: nuclear transport factor 2 family protein [Chloroflexi bacterium]|nr:nuclear transport factor 2 family protein [Chloroflexota bacterium]
MKAKTEGKGTLTGLMVLGVVVAAALALLFALACGGGDGAFSGGSDEAQVRAVLERETKLIRQGDWRDLWELLSPQTREQCPYGEFLSDLQGDLVFFRALVGDPDKIGISEVEIEVVGDTAFASYITTIEGEDVDFNENDIFVKVDGRWYDVDEDSDQCPDSGEGARGFGAQGERSREDERFLFQAFVGDGAVDDAESQSPTKSTSACPRTRARGNAKPASDGWWWGRKDVSDAGKC